MNNTNIFKKLGTLILILTIISIFAGCEGNNEKVVIQNVEEIENVSVAYGTSSDNVISQLPTTVEVTLSNNQEKTPQLAWEASENYDATKAGTYQFSGSFTVQGLSDSVEVDVTVLEEEIIVESVSAIDDINVDYGTEVADLDLPDKVEVTLDDESTLDIDVDWDTEVYDGEEAGEYVLTGELINLPEGVINPDELSVEATVVVGTTIMEVSDDIEDIDVPYGTTIADIGLPKTVDVTLCDETTDEITVKWLDAVGGYDSNNPGSYRFEGDLDLSDKDYTNHHNLKAEAKVTVADKIEEPEKVVGVSSLDSVEVPYETTKGEVIAELPQKIDVTLSNGNDLSNVSISEWTSSNFVADNAGTYQFTGILDVSGFANIENPDNETAEVDVVVKEEVFTGIETGELKKIYENGSKIILDDAEYPVTAETQLREYLNQLDEEKFVEAVDFTVQIEKNEVTELKKIELTGDSYDYIAFNTLVNGIENGVTGVEIVGQNNTTTTTVTGGINATSGVTGTSINILMNRVNISNIDFDVEKVNVGVIRIPDKYDGTSGNPDLQQFESDEDLNDDLGEYVSINNCTVEGDLFVDSYNSNISFDSVKGGMLLTSAITEINIDDSTSYESEMDFLGILSDSSIANGNDININAIIGDDTNKLALLVDISDFAITGSSSITGEVNLNGENNSLSAATIDGDIFAPEDNAEINVSGDITGDINLTGSEDANLTANSIEGDVDADPDNTTIEVVEDITGDISLDGTDAVLSADTVDGILGMNNENADVSITSEITGDVNIDSASTNSSLDVPIIGGTLDVGATIDLEEMEIKKDLDVNASDVKIKDIDVIEVLTILDDNAEITDSSFGELSNANTGLNAEFTDVTFISLNEAINALTSNGTGPVLEGTEEFEIGLDGWTFTDMDWPVEDSDLTIDVKVNADNIAFENTGFTGNVDLVSDGDATDENIKLFGCTFPANLNIGGAVVGTEVDEFTINGELAINSKSKISNGTITGDNAQIADGTAENTEFNNVTFDFDSTGTQIFNVENGMTFDDCTFNYAVEVAVNDGTEDEQDVELLNGCEFNDDTILTLNAANNEEVNMNDIYFGEDVEVTLAGDQRVTITDSVFEYDETAPQTLTLDDGDLDLRFNSGEIYRPVTVTNVFTTRFLEETYIYNDITVEAGDVRLVESTVDSSERDITITANSALLLNTVTFEGSNNLDIKGAGGAQVKFTGDINGNDKLTVDNSNIDVYFDKEAVIENAVFNSAVDETATDTVDNLVTLNNLTFEDNLIVDSDDFTLKGAESDKAVVEGNVELDGDNNLVEYVEVQGDTGFTVAGKNAEINNVDLTGTAAELAVTGNDANLNTVNLEDSTLDIDGNNPVLNSVTVANALDIDGNNPVLNSVTVANDADFTNSVAPELTSVEVTKNLTFDDTNAEPVMSDVTVEGNLTVTTDGNIDMDEVSVTGTSSINNVDNNEDFVLDWNTGSTGAITLDVDTETESGAILTSVDVAGLTVDNSSGKDNIELVSVNDAKFTGQVTANANPVGFEFNNITFDSDPDAVFAADFVANFNDSIFKDGLNVTADSQFDIIEITGALDVNSAVAVLENVTLTDATDVALTSADTVDINEGNIVETGSYTDGGVTNLTISDVEFIPAVTIDNTGTFDQNDFADTVTVTDSATFTDNTFNNGLDVDADAEFDGAEISDILDVNSAGAVLENITLTDATDVTLTSADVVSLVDGNITNNLDVDNPIGTSLDISNITFETGDTIDYAATFANNVFEGNITVNDGVGSTFSGDTFKADVTLNDGTSTYTDLHFESADTLQTVEIEKTLTFENANFTETGTSNSKVVVAGDKTLILNGDIDYSNAANLEIDASAPGATVDDTDANWIPDDKITISSIVN